MLAGLGCSGCWKTWHCPVFKGFERHVRVPYLPSLPSLLPLSSGLLSGRRRQRRDPARFSGWSYNRCPGWAAPFTFKEPHTSHAPAIQTLRRQPAKPETLSKIGDWLRRPKRCLRVDAAACPRFSAFCSVSFPLSESQISCPEENDWTPPFSRPHSKASNSSASAWISRWPRSKPC